MRSEEVRSKKFLCKSMTWQHKKHDVAAHFWCRRDDVSSKRREDPPPSGGDPPSRTVRRWGEVQRGRDQEIGMVSENIFFIDPWIRRPARRMAEDCLHLSGPVEVRQMEAFRSYWREWSLRLDSYGERARKLSLLEDRKFTDFVILKWESIPPTRFL